MKTIIVSLIGAALFTWDTVDVARSVPKFDLCSSFQTEMSRMYFGGNIFQSQFGNPFSVYPMCQYNSAAQ